LIHLLHDLAKNVGSVKGGDAIIRLLVRFCSKVGFYSNVQAEQ